MAAHVFSANVRLAVVTALGALTGGYVGILNTTKLELDTPEPDILQQISKQNGQVGQIKSQAFIPKPAGILVNIDDLSDQRVLGWALNGSVTSANQAGATVTAEPVTAGALGDWVPLANRQVTALTVKDSTGTTTYVNNVDYIADTISGFIMPLSTGAIAANDILHVAYTAPALTIQRVAAATVTSRYLRIDADMVSLQDQSRWHFVCPVFQAFAAGNLDLLGKDFLVAALKGSALVPTSNPPYTLDAISTGS